MKYLKLFASHSDYSTAQSSLDKPNVSHCVNEDHVHYNPWVDNRIIATFNITNTSSTTPIMYSNARSKFSKIEIDGVVQPSVVTSYKFDTIGEHIIKYTLINDTTTGNYTFCDCRNLTSVILPNSMISIGSEAFKDCYVLTSVTIPNSVTNIGGSAFSGCRDLAEITIPNSVTSIGQFAFAACSGLTSVIIGNSVISIGSAAFRDCTSLPSIIIPSSVTSISGGAFFNCTSLNSIVCNAITAPTIKNSTFDNVKTGGTLIVPSGSTGYDVWMGTGNYYLGKYNWTKVEQ